MAKKKYQVFISSTYIDLKDERLAVTQTLLDNDCIPVGMEQFPSSGMSQMEYIKKMLDDCDYYILILGGRYGSLDSDGIGFTEKEFDYAESKGMPIMSFLVEDIGTLPRNRCEMDNEGQEKYRKFREKVLCGRMVKLFKDIGSLQAAVATSINRCKEDLPAIGWVRGSEITKAVKNSEISGRSKGNSMMSVRKSDSDERDLLLQRIANLEDELRKMPRIHVGKNPPQNPKEGDIWLN